LLVLANTSFAGFPPVAAIVARDGSLPHQLTSLGDRLVSANGILLLAVATAAILLVSFSGDGHALVSLFAIGALLALTLSESGMVVHWWGEPGRVWWLKAAFNGLGALATATTLLVVAVSEFAQGAWIRILLIPALVVGFLRIRAQYRDVAQQLSPQGLLSTVEPSPPPRVVIPISGVHGRIVEAVAYARSISRHVTAAYVGLEPGEGERIQEKWQCWWPDLPCVVLPSPYRSIVGPLLEFLDETDRQHNDGQLATVVVPEFVPARRWHGLLHNQTAWLINAALLYRWRRVGFQRAIMDIPYHLKR